MNRPVSLQIVLRDGRKIRIEGATSPLHAEWLWDMFQIPKEQQKELIELVLPAEILREHPPE